MTEPARWMDAPAEAPHGAVELLRHVEPAPPLDSSTRAEVACAVGRLADAPAPAPTAGRWMWMAAAAVLLFSLGVATTLVLTTDEGGDAVAVPRSPVGPATSMQPVAPEPDPSPSRMETPAEVVEAPEPQPAAEASEPEAPEPRPARRPEAPVRRAPTHEPVARTHPAPHPRQAGDPRAEGYLTLNTMPWSRVTLDGRDIGNTPIVRHRVAAGRHELVFRPRGDADQTIRRTIVVEAGKTHRFVIRF